MFYFSLATLVLGVIGAGYLFLDWLYHGRQRKFALLWAIGLFLLYWFQIPAILSYANKSFSLADFNLFFSFAFPTSFIGSLLIYAGILSVTRPPSRRRNIALIAWAVVAAVLFAVYFAGQSTITNYSSTFIFIFLFFVPLYILALFELWRWLRKTDWPKTKFCHFGIAILMAAFILGLSQNFVALDRLLDFPPAFWFLAIANSPVLFIMQAFGVLLLLVGFFLVHQNCCRVFDERQARIGQK